MNPNRSFITFLSAILVCVIINNGNGQVITFESLLEEMADRHHLSYFPETGYELKQFSSYNRRSKHPDSSGWFANNDMSHFLRVENNKGRREFVMFDEEGPGAIVRWWMTFYKAQNGIIRIYLDHDPNPVVEGSPASMLRGDLLAGYPFSAAVHEGAPLGEEGRDYDHNLYLPIPFSEHAKITYECDSLILKYNYGPIKVKEGYYWPDVFYNINYRKYPEGTHVESFTKEALANAGKMMHAVGEILLDRNAPGKADSTCIFQQNLQPGDSMIFTVTRKTSAIEKFSLKLEAEHMEQALRSVVVSASFDGHSTVWVPAGEFFGVGYVPAYHSTWINAHQENGGMLSRWVMPFQENCQILLINFGDEPVQLNGSIEMSDYEWKPNSMYFGAAWHEYRHIRTRDDGGSKFDLNFINIDGKGVYVGDQVTLFNNTWHWWGEGDEKIFVDGETFPSHFGTGTEDYFGFAWCSNQRFSSAYVGQPLASDLRNFGRISLYRFHLPDPIPFTESLRFDLEINHWDDAVDVNYDGVAFWYARPGSRAIGEPPATELFALPPLAAEEPAGIPPGPYRCGGG